MKLITDVNSRRIRMHDVQADVVALDLSRQFPALFSIPARLTGGAVPGLLHALLSSLLKIAARPGWRNLHNLSSGVKPRLFSRPRRHHRHDRQKTGATLTFGQDRTKEWTALTAEPRLFNFTSLVLTTARVSTGFRLT
jgi:hypothetical protein